MAHGAIHCLVPLLIAVVGGASTAMASPGPDAGATGNDARLHLVPDPDYAHVYVRQGRDDEAGLCEGECTLTLAPGTYRIAAGFTHSDLATASESVRVAAGELRGVGVTVRENVAKNAIRATWILALSGLLVTEIVVMADRGELNTGVKSPLTVGLGVGILGCLLGGAAFEFLLEDTLVDLSPATEKRAP